MPEGKVPPYPLSSGWGVLSFPGEGMLGTGRYSVSLGRGYGEQFYLNSKQVFPVSQQCAPRCHCLVVMVRGSPYIRELSTSILTPADSCNSLSALPSVACGTPLPLVEDPVKNLPSYGQGDLLQGSSATMANERNEQ